MGLFDWFNKAKAGVMANINPAYSQNKDFLEAVCAAAAFVSAADGDISDSEKTETIRLLSEHGTLGKLYSVDEIRKTSEKMLSRALTQSGRLQLNRELDDLNNKPDALRMKEDVYYVAADVAMADGEVSAQETAVLNRLAQRLGVKVDTTLS